MGRPVRGIRDRALRYARSSRGAANRCRRVGSQRADGGGNGNDRSDNCCSVGSAGGRIGTAIGDGEDRGGKKGSRRHSVGNSNVKRLTTDTCVMGSVNATIDTMRPRRLCRVMALQEYWTLTYRISNSRYCGREATASSDQIGELHGDEAVRSKVGTSGRSVGGRVKR
jgi:hypothetical protein